MRSAANVFACTWVGATQVILPRFDASAVLAAIERERVTHAVLVPTMLAMLLDAPEAATADVGSLRHIQYAASPISPELQRRVLEWLPWVPRHAQCIDVERSLTIS